MNNTTRFLITAALATAVGGSAGAAEILIEKRYLHVPVAREGDSRMVLLMDGDRVARYFKMAWPTGNADPQYWSSTDVGPWQGKHLTVKIDPPAEGLDFPTLCEQSDSIRRPPNAYRERHRPQFHFTPMVGWTNDPNGLVYLDGEYHLFFQHNPYGTEWGNMTWGHAVSRDLVHWEEIGDALYADRLGTMYSGSAVVDHNNTSGFGKGSTPPIVNFFTSAGAHSYEKRPFTQSIAYSTDRGRTWTKYAGNPVVDHIDEQNRDPKVFWHKASGQWVMVLYLTRGEFTLLASRNLREWRKLSDVPFPDGHECPELFELPVDGDRGNTRWVMWEGGGRHLIGRFDGKKFTPETDVLTSEFGNNNYAAQTWNDVPDGRRILIGWMRARGASESVYPGMPFNQQMTFPRELSLKTTPNGIRLFMQPAREITKLHAKQHRKTGVALSTGQNPLSGIEGELFDIEAVIELGQAKSVTLDIRGTPVVYDAVEGKLSCLGKSAPVAPTDGHLDLRVLVDRTSIEIFAAGGRYVMSYCFRPEASNRRLALSASGGPATVKTLEVREIKSIWAGAGR